MNSPNAAAMLGDGVGRSSLISACSAGKAWNGTIGNMWCSTW